ncbi:oxidoreductase family protein [Paraglaciecola aestuariivivens]
MSQLQILSLLKQHFSDPCITKQEVVQSLWSGYGEIARYFSPRLDQSIIVKHIDPVRQPKHPKGWNTQTSHLRKLHSYQVEGAFYKFYADQCDLDCKVPNLLTSFNQNQQQVLVLTDLDSLGFSVRKSTASNDDIKHGIKWLANFHARFFQHQAQDLWPIGCYWHLATRQDELAAMQDGPLKQHAQQIDQALNQAKFQTLVHGDAKLANFCFPDDRQSDRLAAVDFQYVGKGVGVKDLAYFLGSCLAEADLFALEQPLVDCYFSYLKQGLEHYQQDLDWSALESEWRRLYDFAWADFYRFLLGWSPEHFKINAYMQERAERVITNL